MFEAFIASIKEAEGFRAKAYWDVRQWTYGYGTKAPHAKAQINKEEAEKQCREYCADIWNFKIQEVILHPEDLGFRKIAVAHMIYQMGLSGVKSFKNTLSWMNSDMSCCKWARAAYHASKSKWAKQTPVRAQWVIDLIYSGDFVPFNKKENV